MDTLWRISSPPPGVPETLPHTMEASRRRISCNPYMTTWSTAQERIQGSPNVRPVRVHFVLKKIINLFFILLGGSLAIPAPNTLTCLKFAPARSSSVTHSGEPSKAASSRAVFPFESTSSKCDLA